MTGITNTAQQPIMNMIVAANLLLPAAITVTGTGTGIGTSVIATTEVSGSVRDPAPPHRQIHMIHRL
ncbi:hypothetical protein ANO14919_118000 [Xylariales sp. No.14919]|nr:hypothetical protein ANO14919_118000 [Xylariales sp. No.14919]